MSGLGAARRLLTLPFGVAKSMYLRLPFYPAGQILARLNFSKTTLVKVQLY